MHEVDVRPPNEKSRAYHLNIAHYGYEICLLTPPAILALRNVYLKYGVCKFVVLFA